MGQFKDTFVFSLNLLNFALSLHLSYSNTGHHDHGVLHIGLDENFALNNKRQANKANMLGDNVQVFCLGILLFWYLYLVNFNTFSVINFDFQNITKNK